LHDGGAIENLRDKKSKTLKNTKHYVVTNHIIYDKFVFDSVKYWEKSWMRLISLMKNTHKILYL